jgi:3-methyladenine DNA glycosylase AlkD
MYDLYEKITQIIENAPTKKDNYFDIQKYLGTRCTVLGVTTEARKKIVSDFYHQFPAITFEELSLLLDRLNNDKIFEEKTIGTGLIMTYKQYYHKWTPQNLHNWLVHLNGWCEIDSLCQSTFEPSFFLNDWPLWQDTLRRFSKDKNFSVRRASLVLLCKSVRKSDDIRFRDLAFANITELESEKNILITKAVSWLLRSMTKHHPQKVNEFLKKHEQTLPKIAIRETRNKLLKGKKN